MRHVAVQPEAEPLQRRALFRLGDVHAHQARDAGRIQLVGPVRVGHGAGLDHLGCLTTRVIHDHPHRMLQPHGRERGINAPLEPVTGIGIDLERAAGIGDLDRIPIGAFDKDIDRLLGAAGLLPAHHATDALRSRRVRNHHLTGLEDVGFSIEREDLLTALCAVHPEVALYLVHIENVQRAVQVVGEEVRHIDQEIDRAQADGADQVLQPFGAWPVLYTTDHPPAEQRVAVQRVLVDRHRHVGLERRRHRIDLQRLEGTQAPRRQIARDAMHAQGVRTVGRDRDLDHRVDLRRIVRGQPFDIPLPHLSGGQFDDAVMLLRKLHLAFGTHHPVALHAADLAHADGRIDSGDVGAGLGHHDGDPLPRVGRAANDLRLPVRSRHLAHTQTVGIGMLLGLQHLSDGEILEPRAAILDALDLQPDIGQRLGNLVERGFGLQMVFEPGQGEFHLAALS